MNPSSRTHPTVSIVTSHGRQTLSGTGDERVIDLLTRYQVPWSAVSIYIIPRSGGNPKLYPCLNMLLSEVDALEILVYFSRNVNPFIFSMDQFKIIDSTDPSAQATEYFYQRLDSTRATSEVFLKRLSPEECRSVIAERVAETIRGTVPSGSHVVVGVSGGGDSNALLYGLSKIRDNGLVVHPIMIKGIPDWDQGIPRARELCDSYGLDLVVLEEQDVKELVGIPRNSVALVNSFEREFEGDDFEFLGTLLIRLALSKHARDISTNFICTGLNLEDILCESLFRISTGLVPAPFPSRSIGDITLILPLWLCPKRIIHGCFPKFSLDNYNARYPCFSLGRNLYYSIVYTMQSQFPGFIEQKTRGLSELSLKNPVSYVFDEQLGFHVERFIPFPLRRKFQRMLGGGAVD